MLVLWCSILSPLLAFVSQELLRTRLLAVSSSDISPAQPVSLLLLSPDPVLLLFWPFSLLPSCLRWLVVEILPIIFYFQHKPV